MKKQIVLMLQTIKKIHKANNMIILRLALVGLVYFWAITQKQIQISINFTIPLQVKFSSKFGQIIFSKIFLHNLK